MKLFLAPKTVGLYYSLEQTVKLQALPSRQPHNENKLLCPLSVKRALYTRILEKKQVLKSPCYPLVCTNKGPLTRQNGETFQKHLSPRVFILLDFINSSNSMPRSSLGLPITQKNQTDI